MRPLEIDDKWELKFILFFAIWVLYVGICEVVADDGKYEIN